MESSGYHPQNLMKPSATKLFKQSFQILKSDKELALFPILAAVLSVIGGAIVFGVFLLAKHSQTNGSNSGFNALFIFIYYLVEYYILIYFGCGLAACVLSTFEGNKPSFSYGISVANQHKGTIFGYAVLAAIVGVIFRVVAERFGWVGEIVAGILGIAWSLATVFIAPVLITTDLKPVEAVKESAKIFKATWGNTVKGAVGFGLIGILGVVVALVPGVAFVAIGSKGLAATGIIISIVLIVAVSIIVSTCSAIYRTALFHYATHKTVPEGFDQSLQLAVR